MTPQKWKLLSKKDVSPSKWFPELEEEVGIKATESQLHFIAKVHAFSTKATETVHLFLAVDCEFNSQQNLDANEEIEVLKLSYDEVEEKMLNGQIWDAEAIAAWELAKKKYPTLLPCP